MLPPCRLVLPFLGAVLAAAIAPASAQTIVRSWPVTPAGTALIGGVAYDAVLDEIWTANEGTGVDWLQRYSRTGTLLSSIAAPIPPGSNASDPKPVGLDFDPIAGTLWVADGNDWVYEIARDGTPTGLSFPVTPTLGDCAAVAIDPIARTLWVSDDSRNVVAEFARSGAPIRSLNLRPAGSVDGDGLDFDPLRQTFWLGEDRGDALLEIDTAGALVRRVAVGGLGISPDGVALDTRTGSLFVVDGSATRTLFELGGVLAAPRGAITAHGRGCPDSGGAIPVLGFSDLAEVGRATDVAVQTSLAPGTPALALFLVGVGRGPGLNLGVIGAPACDVLLDAIVATAAVRQLGAAARAGFLLPVPAGAALVGARIGFQCALWPDVGAPGGISLSNGVEVVVQ